MNTLFVAWQDPSDRHWRPVGRLSWQDNRFQFVYTKGAATANNFVPFGKMVDLYSVYESKELFPLFSNRLLPKNRPEYIEYLQWLNIPIDKDDPLALLARSGGLRGTDSLMIFPCPEPTPEGKYQLHFFSQGLRYLPDNVLELATDLAPGMQLYLMLDVQNKFDSLAVALRTEKPPVFLGYVPRYFTEDFHRLLKDQINTVQVIVERVNLEAPSQFRLLCKITADWPNTFKPCSGDNYQPLPQPLFDSDKVSSE